MKMMNKVCALLVSAALCAGMAAPALAFEGDTAPWSSLFCRKWWRRMLSP